MAMKYVIYCKYNDRQKYEVDHWNNYGESQIHFKLGGKDYYIPWTSIDYIKEL